MKSKVEYGPVFGHQLEKDGIERLLETSITEMR